MPSFVQIAKAAAASLDASPYLASSANDQAHNVGLWAAQRGLSIFSLKASKGHKWVLNGPRKGGWQLDFSKSNTHPDFQAF